MVMQHEFFLMLYNLTTILKQDLEIYADEFGGEEEYDSTIIDFIKQEVIINGNAHSFESFIEYQQEMLEHHDFTTI